METAIVKLSDIAKHPISRLDAAYWTGRKEGKKAFVKKDKGLLVEDDINGKIMLSETDSTKYNEAVEEYNISAAKLQELKNKFNAR
jgi:hypothetical protein